MPDSIIKADNISSLSGGGVGFPDGSISNPSMKFTNDGDTGLYRIGNNTIGIASNGSRVGEIGNGYGGFTGNIIQVTYAEISTSGVGTPGQIPFDDTIPQNTEGFEVITCSITPKYSNSKILIECLAFVGEETNTSNGIAAALFRDNIVNALNMSFFIADNGNNPFGASLSFAPLFVGYLDNPNTTSSITYKLRIGTDGVGSVRFNGNNGSRRFGGALKTYIKLMELQQ